MAKGSLNDMEKSAVLLDKKRIDAMAMMAQVGEWVWNSEFYFENLNGDQLYLSPQVARNEVWLTGPTLKWKHFKFTVEQIVRGTWWTGNTDLVLAMEQRVWLYTCLSICSTWLENCAVNVTMGYLTSEDGRTEPEQTQFEPMESLSDREE